MTKLAILFLFCVVVLAIVMFQGKQYEKFAEHAKKVTGKIERKDERKMRQDQPTRLEHWLVYSYEVEGKSFTAEDKIEFTDLWMDYKVGAEVEIYYNGENPKESHPAAVFDRRISMTRKLSN